MMNKLRSLFVWLKSFWARPVAEPAKAEEAKEIRPKRKYNKEKSKTLSDLLDNLEYTFGAMKIDYEEMSLMGKGDIEGLKKFGVSVIPNSLEKADETSKINDGIGFPSIIFLALSALVPFNLNTIGLESPTSCAAVRIDYVNTSHFKIPPKILTKMAFTSLSLFKIFIASVI
jgi:hypothetical protein